VCVCVRVRACVCACARARATNYSVDRFSIWLSNATVFRSLVHVIGFVQCVIAVGRAAINHNLFQDTGSTGMCNFLFSPKTSVANCQ
jgi:hypothetical protein